MTSLTVKIDLATVCAGSQAANLLLKQVLLMLKQIEWSSLAEWSTGMETQDGSLPAERSRGPEMGQVTVFSEDNELLAAEQIRLDDGCLLSEFVTERDCHVSVLPAEKSSKLRHALMEVSSEGLIDGSTVDGSESSSLAAEKSKAKCQVPDIVVPPDLNRVFLRRVEVEPIVRTKHGGQSGLPGKHSGPTFPCSQCFDSGGPFSNSYATSMLIEIIGHNEKFMLSTLPDILISDLKLLIAERMKVDCCYFYLVFQSKIIDEQKHVNYLNIANYQRIEVRFRLRGGMISITDATETSDEEESIRVDSYEEDSTEEKVPVINSTILSPFKSSKFSSATTATSSTFTPTSAKLIAPTSTKRTASTSASTKPTKLVKEPKPTKAITLKNVIPYNGKEDFKNWIKKFELRLNVSTPNEQVKLATLVDYLHEDLIDWLAELSPEVLKSYSNLKTAILLQYKKEQKTATDLISLITNIKQYIVESITSYTYRLYFLV